jgi:hypothetical protein
VGTAAFSVIAIAWILATRYTSGGDTYSGRALQANGAVHAFLYGLVSSLPGAAWKLEWSTLGARPAVTVLAIAAATVAMLAVVAWMYRDTIRPAEGLGLARQRSLLASSAAAAGAVCYALFAVALESATERIDSGALRIGDVYTFYAVASAAIALAVAVAAWMLAARSGRRWRWIQLVTIVGCGGFLALQGSFNAKLRDVTNADMIQNDRFDAAFARSVPQATRCSALVYWASYPWPDYYRSDVILGSYAAYRHYYGQPFCANWTDPTDGFSEPFRQGSELGWWLTQSSGAIEIEATGCAHGCRGVLSFAAGAFSVPHVVALSVDGVVVGRVAVPTKPKRFSIPVRLSGTFNQIGVAASDHGVTPASVHVDADMRTLFVEIEQPRFVRST